MEVKNVNTMYKFVSYKCSYLFISLAILVGFLSKEKIRKFFRENKWSWWLIELLIFSGAVQLKITCP